MDYYHENEHEHPNYPDNFFAVHPIPLGTTLYQLEYDGKEYNFRWVKIIGYVPENRSNGIYFNCYKYLWSDGQETQSCMYSCDRSFFPTKEIAKQAFIMQLEKHNEIMDETINNFNLRKIENNIILRDVKNFIV